MIKDYTGECFRKLHAHQAILVNHDNILSPLHNSWIQFYFSIILSPNAGKCGKNEDQNNSEYGHFLRSGYDESIALAFIVVCMLSCSNRGPKSKQYIRYAVYTLDTEVRKGFHSLF